MVATGVGARLGVLIKACWVRLFVSCWLEWHCTHMHVSVRVASHWSVDTASQLWYSTKLEH